MKQFLVLSASALLLGALLPAAASDAVVPCWRGQPGTTFQDWDFRSSANPAAPDFVTNSFGVPSDTVAPGPFSDGYFATIPGSTNVGWWDLGQSGTMTCVIPNRPSAPSASYKLVWVQVAQYIGGVFPNFAAVSITNGVLLGGQHVFVTNIPPLGNLYVDQTMWRIEPNPASEAVLVTSPSNGSLVDEVIVDTWCVTNSNSYVDDDYAPLSGCAVVGWPYNVPPQDKFLGQNAFATLQQGITNAPTNGMVLIASGSYAGNVTVSKNLTLSPGPAAAAISLAGNLALTPGSTLAFDVSGSTPGTQYDRWTANGTVDLGGSSLSLNDTVALPLNTSILLIDNDGADPIIGTFAGLPEGAVINGLNQQFHISYVGGSGNDVVLTVANHSPVAVTDYAATAVNTPVVIPIAKLLANDFDPDNDAFAFVSASAPSMTNGTVTFDANNVTYTPPSSFSGSNYFTYLIQDSNGGVGSGRVDVLVRDDSQTFNIISISTTNSGASFTVRLAGIPFRTYTLQRAPTVLGPWTSVAPVPIGASGIADYYDNSPPPGTGFYRTSYP